MASALAQQLAQLKGVHVQERWTKGKHSLLFDYQKAADVSAETLLGIAQQGIEALCKVDRRYVPFTDSLFSRASLSIARDQLTKDENEQLDTNIRAFLRVLVNHFLLPAAFQVLEYCIRRYQVHVYNVPDVLVCTLPYHSTPEFARLVALLQLKGTRWEWLTPCQQSGAPPPRELLVRRCVNDQAVIREACKGAESLGAPGFVSKTYLSFYAVLLCEVFTAAPQVTEELLTVLLPYLVAGLKSTATRDYRAATLMVLTQLLSRAQLGREFLTAIVPEVIRSAAELGDSTAIMLLTHMAASQPELKALPAKSLQLLLEHCQTGQQLSDLQGRGADVAPLLKLLLPSLAQALPQHPQLQPLLLDLLNNVTLDSDLIQATAQQLLQAGAVQYQQQKGGVGVDTPADTGSLQQVQQALRVFDLRYPDQLDAAINTALQQATATAADSSKKTPSKPKKGKHAADATTMFEFVQQCFSGSRHEVVAVDQQAGAAQQQQQQALTLSLAVSAPASQMRLMALQKLDAICNQPDAADSTKQLLHSSLLSCLRDDSFAVAGVAAAAAGLAAVPADEQLPALQYLLARAAEKLSAGHASGAAGGKEADGSSSAESSKDILKAAKAALTAVAAVGERAAAGSATGNEQQVSAIQQQAAALLLEYILAEKRLKKLSKAALGVCCSCQWHPLLQLLAASPAVTAAVQHEADTADAAAGSAAVSDSKRRKKGAQPHAAVEADAGKHAAALGVNRAVIQALADGLTSAAGAAVLSELTAVAASCGPRCLHLLQLALVKAAMAAGTDAAAAAGSSVPPTPSGKGRGKGKQQHQSSSQVAAVGSGASATSAQIAVALLHMLEQQLASPAAADKGSSKVKASSGLLLPDWAALAAAALDDSALPTKQHYDHLYKQLPQLQAALLLSGLKIALSAAPVEGLSAQLGQPVQLFARLAEASAVGGDDSLLQHLQLLVSKSADSLQHQLQFLAGIYGLPAGVCSPVVQVAALQLLPTLDNSKQPSADGSDGSWFVQLLATVNSTNKRVRRAAVDALLALPGTVAAAALPPGFTSAELAEFVSAFEPHQELLRGSAGALTPLLCSAAAPSMDVDAAVTPSTASKGRTRAKSKPSKAAAGQTADADTAAAELQLTVSSSQALQQLLLPLLPELHQAAQLQAAELAVAVLAAAAAEPGETASAAQQLLQQFLQGLCSSAKTAATATKASSQQDRPPWQQLAAMHAGIDGVAQAASRLQQLRSTAAVALLQFFTPTALQSSAAAAVVSSYIDLLQLPFADAGIAGAIGGSRLSNPELAAVARVRVAALQQLDNALFAVLTAEQQQLAFAAALQTHSADGDADCRAAARAALEQLPVSADMLLQLLQRVRVSSSIPQPQQGQQSSRAKRTKRGSASQQQQEQTQQVDLGTAASAVVTAADMDAVVAALELLQWKDDVQDKQLLLQPLQDLLRATIPLMGTIAESYQENETPPIPTADDDSGAAAPEGLALSAAAVSPSAAGYATQLALQTLESLVKLFGAAAGSVDCALVLSCAGAAPDGAVRNAALLLLAVLAELAPEDVLAHVLQALSVIQQSAALHDDSHSQAVASAVLSALVPAWITAGRGSDELWQSLLEALPGLPATRRLRLLESLLKALPEESGLPVGLLLMMQRVVAATAPSAAATSDSSSKTPKKAKQQAAAAEESPAAAAAASDESEWLPDLMAALCEQVSVPARLQAFSSVLSFSLSSADGPVAAHEPLPRLAVTFVTANLKARSVLSAARAAIQPTVDTSAASSTIQTACQSIMAQALQHLLQLNPAAAAQAAAGKNSRKTHKAVRAAAAGVYELLAALESVQDCPSYLLALVEMSRHPAESVQRRALKLLAARLLKAQIDLADLESATEGLSAADRQQQLLQLTQAGVAICQDLSRLLQSQAALTRQLALIAADAGIRQFGSMQTSIVLSCLATVVPTAGDAAAPGPVRVSALACIASAVAAVGTQLVPLLPQTAAVVLTAAQAACKDLQGFDHALHKQQQDDADSSSEDDDQEAVAAHSKGEEAALQLAAALAALEALVAALGPFLSPYLKQILQLLLHQQVLSCSTAGAAAAAARLRAALPAKVPARLLLEPVVSQWDYAVAAGSNAAADGPASAEPAAALLDLVATLCSTMELSAAANYHETVLALLLRALDTRQRWLAAAAGHQEQRPAAAVDSADAAAAAAAIGRLTHAGVHVIESAAVKALSALVMKLSESKFKPLFLRMVEWASAGGASAAVDSQSPGRAAAFMAVVCQLAHRLRGMFAPYFKYFAITHMKLLAGEGAATDSKRPKKKAKKQQAAASAGPELGLQISGWLARLRAVRAVHLLALHEPTDPAPAAVQEQQERFDRLLPLVVEQLSDGPNADVAAVLVTEGADSALDLPGGPIAALGSVGKAAVEAGGSAVLQEACDIIGTAALGALQQMAIAGGSDVIWKPLHHAVLMATRGGSTRAKLLALGGVSRLAELLREEYLMLLPEALPFISELIEDGEVAVEGAAQGLIAQLEALSGEKLEQYLKT